MNSRVKSLKAAADPVAEAHVLDLEALITASALRQLRRLPVPPSEQILVGQIYSRVERVLAGLASLSAALRASNSAAVKTATWNLQRYTDAANAASIAYGLTVCGS